MQYVPLLTPEQMASADKATIALGTSGATLMERAGQGAADKIHSRFGRSSACVLCGPGNNGGDGFVIARALMQKGWTVRVACLVGRDKLTGDAAEKAQEWPEEIIAFENLDIHDDEEIVIDSVFGTGLSRAFEAPVTNVLVKISQAGNLCVGIDVPSGVFGEDGSVDPFCLRADLTLTFGAKKPGHVLMPGRMYCGDVLCLDIGIDAQTIEEAGIRALENTPAFWQGMLSPKTLDKHKFDYGHAVIYGHEGMTGAARLCAAAAARMGAGLTTLLCPPDAGSVYKSALPAHIIVREDIGWQDERVTARVIGPGGIPGGISSGISSGDAGALLNLRPSQSCIDILDADALQPDILDKADENCVLTPHEGEFSRIFPDCTQGSKIERAQNAVARFGGVLVLKGPDTVIAAPGRTPVVNTNAPADLATAGAGDVLSGMIAGLCAQGIPAFEAACAAVWIHGRAGSFVGPGLVASDLERSLSMVLSELYYG